MLTSIILSLVVNTAPVPNADVVIVNESKTTIQKSFSNKISKLSIKEIIRKKGRVRQR